MLDDWQESIRVQTLETAHAVREDRRLRREARRGFRAGAFNCRSCGSFTGGPTIDCPRCGDSCAHHNDTAAESVAIGQAFGYR